MGQRSYPGIRRATTLLLGGAFICLHSNAEAAGKVDLLDETKELLGELVAPVPAEPYWYVQGSVWTTHFSPQPDHNNHQDLIGIERHRENSYLWGAATFRHSFGGRSYYAYGGKRFDFSGTPFNAKLTAGLMHGYKGEYRDKIPLNHFGIAPVVIPSVGASCGPVGVDLVLLGAAATMVNVGIKF
ncbi:sn-glycerol-3-phosphate transporter [Pseudomonas sp. FME51]|uniref:sn-glycerol-3-phosphate transporter n=1 Tax=Pseudomonas sp. FME51 TaxID=2742609 RepID=UPI001866E0A6|nr:sn-glycerol-3-phosphate transporter [Pseudomonas sp. FME51]